MRAFGRQSRWSEVRWGLAGPAAVVALASAALTMRAPITVAGPILDLAAEELGDLAIAGLLVSLPLLAFSIAAPVFPALVARLDLSAALQIALGVVAAGLLIRQVPGTVALLVGTALAGIGIAALNVAMPVVVKSRWPNRVGLLTGFHTSVTAVAAAAAAGLALPLAAELGWRGALAAVGAAVALAAGVAVVLAFAISAPSAHGAATRLPVNHVLAHRTTRVLICLMALQAGTYYALVSWLPAILVDAGFASGDVSIMQAIFVLLGVVSGPLAGMWLQCGRRRKLLAVSCTGPLVVALLGLSYASEFAAVWVILAGLSCGGTFTLTLALFAVKSAEPSITAVISAACQCLGYALAAATPPLIGAVAVATVDGDWLGAIVVLAAISAVQVAVAVWSVRSPVVTVSG